MKPEINTETAEAVQTTGDQAVVQERLVRLLGPYFVHGPTLRRLGLGEDTKTEEHKQRGIMMRGCFRGNHAHAQGKRWPDDKGCNTPVYRRNRPPKRKGAICFCILPNAESIHPGSTP